jgi:thiamine kinase-like enzyme
LRTRALAIPEDLGAVGARWLSAALGVEVVGVAPGEPTGGMAVTSQVARLRLELGTGADGPRAVVVKLANPRWTHGTEMHGREVRFYREFAPGRDLPVPRCYHADYDESTGAFILVLEDVGDARPGHRLDGLDGREADAVINGVADLHKAWWQRDELRTLRVRGHDRERIERTVAGFSERWRALEATGKYRIDDRLRTALAPLMAAYADGVHAISSEPQTFIHTDLHVENFFLEETATGLRFIAIDWQNASYGHCAFDVSSVLCSLRPELFADHHERLLRRYHARLARADYDLQRLRGDVVASIRHQLVGSASWFATIEAESLREAGTIQDHWTRLCAAVVATH